MSTEDLTYIRKARQWLRENTGFSAMPQAVQTHMVLRLEQLLREIAQEERAACLQIAKTYKAGRDAAAADAKHMGLTEVEVTLLDQSLLAQDIADAIKRRSE